MFVTIIFCIIIIHLVRFNVLHKFVFWYVMQFKNYVFLDAIKVVFDIKNCNLKIMYFWTTSGFFMTLFVKKKLVVREWGYVILNTNKHPRTCIDISIYATDKRFAKKYRFIELLAMFFLFIGLYLWQTSVHFVH